MIDATALHAGLLTLDSHIDIPWPDIDAPGRQATLPRMREGGLRAACFVAYVPQGPLTPEGHRAAAERAEAMLAAIGAMASTPGIALATNYDEIADAHRRNEISVIPGVENGYAIGEDLGSLTRFRTMGACYVTLCHNGHNLLTDSSNPRADLGDAATRHGGLGALGRDAIREMNRLGLLVDISHVSRNGMMQAIQHSRTPVVATHSCVRALCDNPRNLDDIQLDALRDTEGLIQIAAVPYFLKPGARQASISDYCDHLDYVVRRCGVAHVGISSDFDGGGGLQDWAHPGESGNLTVELVRRGYGATEIAAFWGGNFMRLLRQAKACATAAT